MTRIFKSIDIPEAPRISDTAAYNAWSHLVAHMIIEAMREDGASYAEIEKVAQTAVAMCSGERGKYLLEFLSQRKRKSFRTV